MKNSEYLFYLVHSLTKADKDNFMRYMHTRNRGQLPKYLALYRAIEAQKVYDEAALKAQFDFGSFSEAKKHLSNLLLRVLRIHNEHPETIMQNRLTEIRLLLERSLYHFAMKKIRQAREIAKREERYGALRILADYELVALPFVASAKALYEHRAAVVGTRDDAFQSLAAIRSLQDLHDKEVNAVLDRTSQSGRFSADLVAELERHELLAIPDAKLPARARSIKYRIWNIIRQHQLDFEGRAHVLRSMLSVFESNDFLIREEPVRYVFALGAYALSLSVIGDYSSALEATLKLLQIKSDKDTVRRSVFLNFASNLSSYTLNTGDVAPFRSQMSYLTASLKQHAENTPAGTLAYIRYLFAIVWWCAGNVRQANRFAKRVVSEPAGRTNLQAAGKCFLLIFALEQEDPDLIAMYARTWRRLWQKKAPEFELERTFTNFMTRFVDLAGRQDQKEALVRFHTEVQQYLAGGFEVRADNFIFVVHWLEAKIQEKALVAIVQEKYAAQVEVNA
ncbi:MAG: hypothetical protein AAF998_11605 [Bacteroidota bacterium]